MNNQLLVENIRYLCKITNTKIGELEKRIGISAGYFSRLSHRNSDITINILYQVSEIFSISMNDLVEKRLGREQRIKELKEELAKLEEELAKLEEELE